MALPGANLASVKALVFEGGIPWSEDLPNLLGIFGNKRFNSNPVDDFQRHPPFHPPWCIQIYSLPRMIRTGLTMRWI